MPFRIDPNTGELTVDGNLDRETKDSYDLTIQATDGTLVSCHSLMEVHGVCTLAQERFNLCQQMGYAVRSRIELDG